MVADAYKAVFASEGGGEMIEKHAAKLDAGGKAEMALLVALAEGDAKNFKESYKQAQQDGVVDLRMLSQLAVASFSKKRGGLEIYEFLLDILSREKRAEALVSFMKGKRLGMEGRWAQADPYLKYAASREPGNTVFMNGVLEMYVMTQEFEDAVRVARAILSADPSNIVANIAMGTYYLEEEDFGLSDTFYGRALNLGGESLPILNNMAWLLAKKGNIAKAEEMARAALKIDAQNATVLDTLGVILMQKGDLDGAEEALSNAYTLSETRVEAGLHYSEVLVKQGKWRDAGVVMEDIEVDIEDLSKDDQKTFKRLKKQLKK